MVNTVGRAFVEIEIANKNAIEEWVESIERRLSSVIRLGGMLTPEGQAKLVIAGVNPDAESVSSLQAMLRAQSDATLIRILQFALMGTRRTLMVEGESDVVIRDLIERTIALHESEPTPHGG
jgi:hypothetical protein